MSRKDRQLAYCESFSTCYSDDRSSRLSFRTCYSADRSSRLSFDSAVEDADYSFNDFVGDVHLPADIDEQMDESGPSNWDVGFQPFNDMRMSGSVRRIPGIRLLTSKTTPASGTVEDYPPATELISGDGGLSEKGLVDFIKLHECGVSYAVVAIMGPQSSGKSTLLNHLFDTNFTEMVASYGRSQTTKGIWIAKARNMDPFTMVMDVEGTDGEERGEDGTAFEKQSTLFAITVADILLINMWCHDIGRENAANRPLLKTIFEVMMRLFPSTSPRKTTLHFVIRDKTMSPIETLETKLRTDVQKIWEIVPKTEDLKNTPLTQYFNVEVDALSNYEYMREQFKREVVHLRKRILRVAGDRQGVVPISAFSLHVKKLWETIKQNKDLNLPTHKEMVATVRCEEIAMEKLRLFESNKEWLQVVAAAKIVLDSDFSAKISSILNKYLSEYDSESKYFEEGVRNAKRQYLESQAFELVYPAYINTLGHLRAEVLLKFETRLDELLSEGGGYAESVRTCRQSCELEFDQRCSDAAIEQAKWDASTVRKELVRDIQNHALHVRTDKLPQVVEQCRARLGAKVTKHLNHLFNRHDEEGIAWASIRSFLKREIDSAASAFRSDVAAFELKQATLEQKVEDLEQYARKLVEKRFKEENGIVVQRLEERYVVSLCKKEEPFSKCLKLLSTMAVIRLDESLRDDEVERLLVSTLIGGVGDQVARDDDPLASYTWEKVPPEMTLITPVGCKDIWVQFEKDIEHQLNQIKFADEKENVSYEKQMLDEADTFKKENVSYEKQMLDEADTFKEKKSKSLPYWMRVGVWVLGVGRFVWLSWNLRFEWSSLIELAVEGKELAVDFPEPPKEMVKNRYKRMKGKYRQIMKKLEEALKRFYNFMKGIFPKESVVEVVS